MTMTRLSFLAAAAFVAGCSTPPDHFHTLRPATAPASAREASRVLAIGPVTVPASLARDEWVIRNGDTSAMVYDHQLWTQDLSADIAQSLADYLDRPAPLRLRVQVLRFDSMLSPAAAVSDQVRWTLECLPSDTEAGTVDAGRYRLVRTAVRDAAGPAPAGNASIEASQQPFDSVARAHSETLRLVSEDVAAALRASVAERAQACVSSHSK